MCSLLRRGHSIIDKPVIAEAQKINAGSAVVESSWTFFLLIICLYLLNTAFDFLCTLVHGEQTVWSQNVNRGSDQFAYSWFLRTFTYDLNFVYAFFLVLESPDKKC